MVSCSRAGSRHHVHVGPTVGPQGRQPAGFDLTLSPLKSVSTLWAVAAPAVAAAIERAHRAAVNGALTLIEQQALFTRTGPQGIRQVDVCGLVRRRGPFGLIVTQTFL